MVWGPDPDQIFFPFVGTQHLRIQLMNLRTPKNSLLDFIVEKKNFFDPNTDLERAKSGGTELLRTYTLVKKTILQFE